MHGRRLWSCHLARAVRSAEHSVHGSAVLETFKHNIRSRRCCARRRAQACTRRWTLVRVALLHTRAQLGPLRISRVSRWLMRLDRGLAGALVVEQATNSREQQGGLGVSASPV